MPPPQGVTPQRVNKNPAWAILLAAALLIFLANQTGTTGAELTIIATIGLAIAFVALVFRALYRLGDKREPPVIVNTAPVAPAAGWYLDPNGQTRWFDGQQWTDMVQPPQP